MFAHADTASRFFHGVTARPRLVLLISVALIAVAATGLGRLVKDTSVKAFIPPDHPALLADERATDIFGLSDSIAVAVMTRDGSSIFESSAFDLLSELSDRVAALPNVRADRVTSLATEASISGGDGAVDVVPYIEQSSSTAADVANSRVRWREMPPHVGTLVSSDETGAIILAELIDAGKADDTYRSVLDIVGEIDTGAYEIHVAGPGAVSGYLSDYIDRDARKLQPLVFLVVLAFIYLAFRRFRALPGPLLVVVGAAGGALGIMAWAGVPYYAITNALPVIVVAISVADAIHILSAYFQFRARLPDESVRNLVVRSMVTMARPITLTTLTTIAGFAGIGFASIMPPITAFAGFAALGVALAWLFSIFALPNMLILLRLGPSPAFANWQRNVPSGAGRFLARIGAFAAARYGMVLALFAISSAIALYGATQLRIDRSQIENFAAGEPIRVADERINSTFAGTAFLDVIIESSEPEGLLDYAAMRRIADLQNRLESLPHVQKTVGITDYISQLYRAIEPGEKPNGHRMLPEEDGAIAQYLLIYEMSGDPTDFEEEIDYGYQFALVRGVLNTHYFSERRETVEMLQSYIDTQFNDATLTATLAGDVTVGYHWMSRLEQSHFIGIGLSLALVLATSILVFRSVTAGLVAVVPVTFAVLVLYAVMGYLGIYLEPATSMFAAIALGVGVDFGIHLVERLREAYTRHADNTSAAVDRVLPATARACFFNSAALGLGFAVLLASDLPTLQRFGGLVAVAAVSSYVAALVIVPALFAAESALWRRASLSARKSVTTGVFTLALLTGSLLFASYSEAGQYTADDIAHHVAARPEGKATQRTIDIVLTNKRGRSKARRALVLKENRGSTRFTRITYTEPKAIRDTAFLSHDVRDTSSTDKRWFYMPSLRKVRRVPASDRGDYFLGTDFTYEDIQSELKFDTDDYLFYYDGSVDADGRTRHRLSGKPVNERVATELGYGAFRAVVDESTWMPIKVEFMDLDQQPLKTIHVDAIAQVNGIWTATDIRAVNHQTGHQTHFVFRDISYPNDLPDLYFEPPALTRGLPVVLSKATP